MKAVLLDTHAWAWGFLSSMRLSPVAKATMAEAETVWVSPISFYEIGQKVRIGKWPEMKPFIADIRGECELQGIKLAFPDIAICLRAGTMDWHHRDPFDRMLAATALEHALPIVSADTVFDGIVSRIW